MNLSVTKYRKRILIDNVAKTMSNLIKMLCEEHGWPIITQPDHIHLFLTVSVVKILKKTVARKLF